MNKSDYLERKINGHRYVLRPHEHINQHPDSNFLGTGLALVGELWHLDTLEWFINRQKARDEHRGTIAEKPEKPKEKKVYYQRKTTTPLIGHKRVKL